MDYDRNLHGDPDGQEPIWIFIIAVVLLLWFLS